MWAKWIYQRPNYWNTRLHFPMQTCPYVFDISNLHQNKSFATDFPAKTDLESFKMKFVEI